MARLFELFLELPKVLSMGTRWLADMPRCQRRTKTTWMRLIKILGNGLCAQKSVQFGLSHTILSHRLAIWRAEQLKQKHTTAIVYA